MSCFLKAGEGTDAMLQVEEGKDVVLPMPVPNPLSSSCFVEGVAEVVEESYFLEAAEGTDAMVLVLVNGREEGEEGKADVRTTTGLILLPMPVPVPMPMPTLG